MPNYNFQYCQKLIVISPEKDTVLLCKRKGEADYDGVFSFIGGKMETSDVSIMDWLKREKDEEVGETFHVKVFPTFTHNALFRKKDWNAMILPHYLGFYESWEVVLSDEYSEYQWVKIQDLETFEPKISNIPEIVHTLLKLDAVYNDSEFVLI